jgi:hypothetical protein
MRVFLGSSKRVINWRKFKNEKQKKKGAYYNCAIKGHFVRKCHKKNKDGKTNSKVLHK